MEHSVTIFLWCLRAYGWLARSPAGLLLERMHRGLLRLALVRGEKMGSDHQLRCARGASHGGDLRLFYGRCRALLWVM